MSRESDVTASRLCVILNWIGRVTVSSSAALNVYIAFNPATAGGYGVAAGIFVVSLFGVCVWFATHAAIYLLGGD